MSCGGGGSGGSEDLSMSAPVAASAPAVCMKHSEDSEFNIRRFHICSLILRVNKLSKTKITLLFTWWFCKIAYFVHVNEEVHNVKKIEGVFILPFIDLKK